jgi:acetylornithine deacetylase/succinyl-diaminopimelate desuccinylase-like protein
MQFRKHTLIVMMVIAMLALFAATVSAQDGGDQPPSTQPGGPRGGRGGEGGPGSFRDRMQNRPDVMRDILEVIVNETGLDARDLMQELRNGTTLNAVIEANGGDPSVIAAEVSAALTERINTALEAGRIDQEQADEMLSNLDQRIEDAMNRELTGRERPIMPPVRERDGIIGNLNDTITELTGLTGREIIELRREGMTLTEILEANGSSADAFVSTITTQAEERLAQAVENERITQERADELLNELSERLTEMLERVPATSI